MTPIVVKTFNKGLVTRIEGEDAPRGSASDCLSWHVLGDHIELRRGRTLLGSEILGNGRVTGLRVGKRFDNHEIIFFTYGRKFLYNDPDTNVNTEISTDLFPTSILDSNGNAEDVSIEQYNSLSGSHLYLTSPSSSIYKVPVANPGSVVDLLQKEYRGKIRIKNSRTFLWDRKDTFGGSDKTGLYVSHVDATEDIYQYTSKEELGTGDGANSSFSGTLAFKASNSKETCFFVVIAGAKSASTAISAITQASSASITSASHGLAVGDTVTISGVVGMTEINGLIAVVLTVPDANTFTVNINSTAFTAYSSAGTVSKSERFIDDRSGNLTGQDGGTGTINYATGAYSINFAVAVISGSKVYAQYYREDSTRTVTGTPDDGGIMNFDYSVPRELGEGIVFRQDDAGGRLMSVESLGNSEYCLHEFKSWIVTLGTPDDTEGTSNVIYRENVGIPYHRAAKATGNGIFYIDVIGENPAVRVLDYGRFSNQVLPTSISEILNLNSYEFDTAVMYEWSDYIILACRSNIESINDRVFMYHKTWKTWEIHSFRVSCFDTLNGALVAGDSGSNNIFKLFSGLSDEEAIIENHYTTNDDGLGTEGIKDIRRMSISGLIGDSQGLKVSYSVDNEPFVEIGGSDETNEVGEIIHHPIIEGDGDYVDTSLRKLIGTTTMGEEMIGGGQDPENSVYASPYTLEFFVGTKRFSKIRFKFEATGFGYLSISEYVIIDWRSKGLRQPVKYISTA